MAAGRTITFIRAHPWAVAGTGYFVLSLLAVLLTRLDGSIALIWFANGMLIPWLAFTRKREWGAVLIACVVGAALAAFVAVGRVTGLGVALPLLGVIECVLTANLLRRWLGTPHFFDSVEGVGKFALIAGLLAPATTAAPAGLMTAMTLPIGVAQASFNWFAAHALGAILVAPIFNLVFKRLRAFADQRTGARRDPRVVLAWLAPVAIVGVLAFRQDTLPLLFLPFVPMMVATLRLGRTGAAASVAILAAIATALTMLGHGPMMLFDMGAGARFQFLQFYLAASVGMVLPVAALLTQRKTLIRDLRASETGYRLMTEQSGDILLHSAPDGTIRRVVGNVAALGYTEDNVRGLNALQLVEPAFRARIMEGHARAMENPGATMTFEYRALLADGRGRWCETRARATLDERGQVTGTISAIRDIDARKTAETELERAATTDQLTGVANRRAFFAAFDSRSEELRDGVLIVADLDHFKSINDRFGHHIGDLALKTYARVAKAELRAGDVVARIGGEEFAFFLPGAQIDQGYALSERLRGALGEARFDNGRGTQERVTASMGMVAVLPDEDAQDALKRADAALYAAKAAGRDCVRLAA